MSEELSFDVTFIRIRSFDLVRSESFYRKSLGLEKTGGSVEDGFLLFLLGSLTLIVEISHPKTSEQNASCGQYLGVSLDVPDIHSVYSTLLARGVRFSFAPQHEFWGAFRADFHDPDDNIWTLVGSWDDA